MSFNQQLITVGVIILATIIMRFAPFIAFPDNKPTPKFTQYLGKVLPYAIMGMLVVYCLKDVTLTAAPFGIPEAIGCTIVAGLHVWKRNTLLSIGAGTLCYMLLVQLVF